jgi:hypothetical protein
MSCRWNQLGRSPRPRDISIFYGRVRQLMWDTEFERAIGILDISSNLSDL